MNKLKKVARSNGETRTYKITGTSETLDQLEKILVDMKLMGDIGSSVSLDIWLDGDGAFWIDIEKEKGDLAKSNKVDSDDETFKYEFE